MVINLKKKEVIEITKYPVFYVDITSRMKEIGMSKTYLCKITGIAYNALQRYAKSKITRVDLNVISRICGALNCNIEDVIKKEE